MSEAASQVVPILFAGVLSLPAILAVILTYKAVTSVYSNVAFITKTIAIIVIWNLSSGYITSYVGEIVAMGVVKQGFAEFLKMSASAVSAPPVSLEFVFDSLSSDDPPD